MAEVVFTATFHALLKLHTQLYPCELEVFGGFLFGWGFFLVGLFLKGRCRCGVFSLQSRIRGIAVNRSVLLVALLTIRLAFFIWIHKAQSFSFYGCSFKAVHVRLHSDCSAEGRRKCVVSLMPTWLKIFSCCMKWATRKAGFVATITANAPVLV